MREQHRRKNFKIGDACDGFDPSRVLLILSKYFKRMGHVSFVEQYFSADDYILKQKVYGSKLVDALCEK
jgi:hypothetical protein